MYFENRKVKKIKRKTIIPKKFKKGKIHGIIEKNQ